MNIRLIKIIIYVSLLCIVAGLAYLCIEKKVTRIELPKGELKWTNVRPMDAKMCIPAAFTDIDGQIYGSYRLNGKTFQNDKMRMKVSLKGETFFISRKWMSDNGFQQLTLVYNSKPMKFYDSRRAVRRALCKDTNSVFILQSNYPMTLSEFALECGKRSTNAVYLDMGEYGYGYIKKNRVIVMPLYLCGIFTSYKQTNWIYIK